MWVIIHGHSPSEWYTMLRITLSSRQGLSCNPFLSFPSSFPSSGNQIFLRLWETVFWRFSYIYAKVPFWTLVYTERWTTNVTNQLLRCTAWEVSFRVNFWPRCTVTLSFWRCTQYKMGTVRVNCFWAATASISGPSLILSWYHAPLLPPSILTLFCIADPSTTLSQVLVGIGWKCHLT